MFLWVLVVAGLFDLVWGWYNIDSRGSVRGFLACGLWVLSFQGVGVCVLVWCLGLTSVVWVACSLLPMRLLCVGWVGLVGLGFLS